jgi:hypothetical protein
MSHFSFKGLKPGGFKLWVTTGFSVYSPPQAIPAPTAISPACWGRAVAVRAAFESKGLKLGFSLYTFKG